MDNENTRLILPGTFLFDETLSTTLPYDWQQVAYKNCGDYGFVVDSSSKLLRVADSSEIEEYLEGGEYDERLLQIEGDDGLGDDSDGME